MASNPTDLIRAADEHHYVAECTNSDCAGCECAACGEQWPCEVRRLFAEFQEARRWAEWFAAAYDHTVKHADLFGYGEFRVTSWAYEQATAALEKHRGRADTAEAALAEANATISRVRHELELSEDRTDDYDAGVSTGMKAVLGRIRRAIEGPAT